MLYLMDVGPPYQPLHESSEDLNIENLATNKRGDSSWSTVK